jgi:hypothetical protein
MNEEIKTTYTLLKTEDLIACPAQDEVEKCRFYLLSETVLLQQICDCPVQDYEESQGSNVSLNRCWIIIINEEIKTTYILP